MLILVPPSESKRPPPDDGPPVALGELSFPELTSLRSRILEALIETSAGSDAFERLFEGPTMAGLIERNTRLLELPTLPASDVYVGELHDGLDVASLSPAGTERAGRSLIITSALWGALRPTDRIPPYRMRVWSHLVGLGRVEPLWRAVLPDLFAELAGSGRPRPRPPDAGIPVTRDAGRARAIERWACASTSTRRAAAGSAMSSRSGCAARPPTSCSNRRRSPTAGSDRRPPRRALAGPARGARAEGSGLDVVADTRRRMSRPEAVDRPTAWSSRTGPLTGGRPSRAAAASFFRRLPRPGVTACRCGRPTSGARSSGWRWRMSMSSTPSSAGAVASGREVAQALHRLEPDPPQLGRLAEVRERLDLSQGLEEQRPERRDPADRGHVGQSADHPELEVAELADARQQAEIARAAELEIERAKALQRQEQREVRHRDRSQRQVVQRRQSAR